MAEVWYYVRAVSDRGSIFYAKADCTLTQSFDAAQRFTSSYKAVQHLAKLHGQHSDIQSLTVQSINSHNYTPPHAGEQLNLL